MAMEANAPLIPCAVWGTQRILTKGRPKNFERKIPISVYLGQPIDYAGDEDPVKVTIKLMEAITELVGKAQAEYPERPKDGEGWWLPAHLGGDAPTVEDADALAAAERAERRARRDAERET
jgi:hypothetical protein